jgi:hypothetical protein
MKYTIDNHKGCYVVKKNGNPICLEGVGLLEFKTIEEAQHYIKLVYESAYYISQGVPE